MESRLCRCRSHPGKLLVDHLQSVAKIGLDIFRSYPYGESEDIRLALKVALLFHDYGKASEYFQDYLSLNIELEEGVIDKESYEKEIYHIGKEKRAHSAISALFCYYILTEQRKVDNKLALIALLAVKKHHGDLRNLSDESINGKVIKDINEKIIFEDIAFLLNTLELDFSKEDFSTFLSTFRFSRLIRKTAKLLDFDDYLLNNLFFSILTRADKADCIMGPQYSPYRDSDIAVDSVSRYKGALPFVDNEIYRIRNRAYIEVEEAIDRLEGESRIYSINLPTGAGKTFNTINAALKLRERFELERIVYCLPFTSIIDQIGTLCRDDLFQTDETDELLIHHHLVEFKYKTDKTEYDDNKSEFLITNWDSEFIVTTFYQLLHSILSNKNRNLRKFSSLANSIIILDEVQAIPFKYWKLVNHTLTRLAYTFNMRIILVTATLPLIFKGDEIVELAASKESYFLQLNRIKLELTLFRDKMNITDFSQHLIEEIEVAPDKSFLIIMNTIKSSLALFKALKEAELDPIYLSSNIVPKERLERILHIKSSKRREVVVATQLVEAGVDIDFDIVYRDFGPLDSIFQACGRCNRNGTGAQGVVRLVRLTNDNDREYSRFIYSLSNLTKTEEAFGDSTVIEEKDFFTLSKRYFELIGDLETVSNNLIKEISGFNYENAFSPKKKDSFQLIEELPATSAYVCVDDEAIELWERYCLLKEDFTMDRYDKKRKLKGLFKKMSNYIITIPKKSDDDLYLIDNDSLAIEYDLETGYIREEQAKDYFF